MIPEKQLKDMGFEEIKSRLFMKNITENTKLYRDYRTDPPTTYAYFKDQKINPNQFNEAKAIKSIEEKMQELNGNIPLAMFIKW